MNLIRLAGDMCHLSAIILLIARILWTESCAGISGRTQILFAVVFTTRYVDLFVYFVSFYNSILKISFIIGTYTTLVLIFYRYRKTYDKYHDTFRIEPLIIAAAFLALLVNHVFTKMEVLWTFSIYLESVAILPQMYMLTKTGQAEPIVARYVFALGCYRALYLGNWIYRYQYEGYYDLIATVAGCVQTVLFLDFFYLYCTREKNEYGRLPISDREEIAVVKVEKPANPVSEKEKLPIPSEIETTVP